MLIEGELIVRRVRRADTRPPTRKTVRLTNFLLLVLHVPYVVEFYVASKGLLCAHNTGSHVGSGKMLRLFCYVSLHERPFHNSLDSTPHSLGADALDDARRFGVSVKTNIYVP